MRKFNLATIEGYEAYLNHGDSERVRMKEENDHESRYKRPDGHPVADHIHTAPPAPLETRPQPQQGVEP